MGAPVEFRDKETLIEAWKLHTSPYYGIFQGKELKFTNEDEDMTQAEDLLDKNLSYLQQAGTSAIYTLRVYPKAPVTAKADYKGSMTFRLSDFDIMPIGNGRGQAGENVYVINQGAKSPAVAGTSSSTDAKLDKLIELITLQMQMQQQQEEEDYDEEPQEPEETEEERIQRKIMQWTQIGSALVPQIKDLFSVILPWGSKSQTNIGEMPQPQQQITDDQLQQAIGQVMQALGDAEFRRVMVGLANMATTNPGQLQMLAKMVN